MSRGTWKKYGYWRWYLENFRTLQRRVGGSQIVGSGGTLEKRHETCRALAMGLEKIPSFAARGKAGVEEGGSQIIGLGVP